MAGSGSKPTAIGHGAGGRRVAKKKLDQKRQAWAEARKRYRLSHAHVQMARELGMNPKKIGSLANHDQEPWKMPLHDYIEHLYEKRFGRTSPHYS